MNNRTTKRALTKNKKWRKIDNTSVDRMTIEKTQEVLEGDIATKSDDQLFVIDTVVNKSKFWLVITIPASQIADAAKQNLKLIYVRSS